MIARKWSLRVSQKESKLASCEIDFVVYFCDLRGHGIYLTMSYRSDEGKWHSCSNIFDTLLRLNQSWCGCKGKRLIQLSHHGMLHASIHTRAHLKENTVITINIYIYIINMYYLNQINFVSIISIVMIVNIIFRSFFNVLILKLR